MNETIFRDAEQNPRIFLWNGEIPREKLQRILERVGWSLPEDFTDFLEKTGGGDLFETETIMGPLGDSKLGDEIVLANDNLREMGMPSGYTAYYLGCVCHDLYAIRRHDGVYVALSLHNFEELEEYRLFDEWYRRTLRKVYAEEYGLQPDQEYSSYEAYVRDRPGWLDKVLSWLGLRS